jgi:type VI protein secretion system component Hcp
MKKYAFLFLLPLAMMAFVRPTHPTHPTASDTYISFKGAKQGQFKAATKGKYGKETEGWFKIQSYDLQDGKPVTVDKEVDAASPLLQTALTNKENLETVVIEIVGRPTTGQGEVVTERITLTNAFISSYKTYSGKEDLSLTYGQVTKTK